MDVLFASASESAGEAANRGARSVMGTFRTEIVEAEYRHIHFPQLVQPWVGWQKPEAIVEK